MERENSNNLLINFLEMKKLRFLYLAGVAALMVASSCSDEQTVMGGFQTTPFVFILMF